MTLSLLVQPITNQAYNFVILKSDLSYYNFERITDQSKEHLYKQCKDIAQTVSLTPKPIKTISNQIVIQKSKHEPWTSLKKKKIWPKFTSVCPQYKLYSIKNRIFNDGGQCLKKQFFLLTTYVRICAIKSSYYTKIGKKSVGRVLRNYVFHNLFLVTKRIWRSLPSTALLIHHISYE